MKNRTHLSTFRTHDTGLVFAANLQSLSGRRPTPSTCHYREITNFTATRSGLTLMRFGRLHDRRFAALGSAWRWSSALRAAAADQMRFFLCFEPHCNPLRHALSSCSCLCCDHGKRLLKGQRQLQRNSKPRTSAP